MQRQFVYRGTIKQKDKEVKNMVETRLVLADISTKPGVVIEDSKGRPYVKMKDGSIRRLSYAKK